MSVAIAVIHDRLLLDALPGHVQRHMNESVRARFGGQRSDFQRVQRLARVAVRHVGQVPQGPFVNTKFHSAQPAFRIGQRRPQQSQQIFLVQGTQLKDLRTRYQRGIDEEERIMRGRAD